MKIEGWLLILLIFIGVLVLVKIYFIKKSIKEIAKSFNDLLKADTNNLITISSTDKEIKELANNLNIGLKELRKQRLQYENGNQELKKIITNISHDLRTPLTSIKGYVNLIKEEGISKKQERYVNILRKKTEELTELTDQLFDFSKTVDNSVKVSKEKCCINELLEETLASYYYIFKEKNIVPETCICKDKIYRRINKISVVRIFENILSNVSKYSEDNFKVELRRDGKIIFSNKTNSLDATTVQKIFDRYFTVENAKKSTGLGLSIAKQLVELNNGEIAADYVKNTLRIELKFKGKE